MNTVNELLKVIEQISGISESNSHFIKDLARSIDETGYDLDDSKIYELITVMEQHREFFNDLLFGNISKTPPHDKAKQAVDALKYISLSLKTVQNSIEQLTSQDSENQSSISLDDLLNKQDQQRGFDYLPLEFELLLKRVKDGGHSGEFLADAFISSYRKTPFDHGLGEIIKLDTEAIRLFHEVLHIRFIPGWNDQALYAIEQAILSIGGKS